MRLPIRGDAAKVLQTVHKALNARRSDRPALPYTTPAALSPDARDAGPFVIAVDCPSGLNCDTGELDKNALHADETITMAAAKPGLLTFPGAAAVGRLHIGSIGLPDKLPELEQINITLVDAAEAGARLPLRPSNSHKGTFGKAMIVAGSLNYVGAAYLAASAAYRVGTGLVTVGAPQIIIPILAGMLPEATWILLPHDMGVLNEAAVRVLRKELEGYRALLLGPGLGREEVTAEFLRELLRPKEEIKRSRAIGFVPFGAEDSASAEDDSDLPPLVIDADGLNLLATMDDGLALIPPGAVLTPHPGEFARLATMEADEVNANRVRLAQEKAAEWNAVIVLKGAFTVVAAPDGRTAIEPFATSALASAGTGDVLAGAITGLLAQGLDPFDAAAAAAWLHGMAGTQAEEIVGTGAGVIASDVLEMLPHAYALAGSASLAFVRASFSTILAERVCWYNRADLNRLRLPRRDTKDETKAMIDVNQLRKGTNFTVDSEIYKVLDYHHIKTGRGNATIRVQVRNLRSNSTREMTFTSGDRVEDIRIETSVVEYLYDDGEFLHFMDVETYDQPQMRKDVFGNDVLYLKENLQIKLLSYDNEIIDYELPTHVEQRVSDAEMAIAGDTATGATKKVITETGLQVTTPLFVEVGNVIRIDTRNGEYITRV